MEYNSKPVWPGILVFCKYIVPFIVFCVKQHSPLFHYELLNL